MFALYLSKKEGKCIRNIKSRQTHPFRNVRFYSFPPRISRVFSEDSSESDFGGIKYMYLIPWRSKIKTLKERLWKIIFFKCYGILGVRIRKLVVPFANLYGRQWVVVPTRAQLSTRHRQTLLYGLHKLLFTCWQTPPSMPRGTLTYSPSTTHCSPSADPVPRPRGGGSTGTGARGYY